jgi:hypothetical protein
VYSVVDVDRAPFERGAGGTAVASGRDGIPLDPLSEIGLDIVSGHDSKELPIEPKDERPLGPAQTNGALGQGLEDRLEVEG